MKRNRWIWLGLWVLSVIGISLSGGVVTYGFFSLLTLLPVLSGLYLLAVFMLFHIYQKLDQRYVTANEPIGYHFSLVNEYPLQFVGIRVRFFSAFSLIMDLDDQTEYELKPGTRIEKHTRLLCRYRGEYEIGIREIEIQDFFRLFTIRYRNRECIHAVVRPQLLPLSELGSIELLEEAREKATKNTEMDVTSRDYVLGDDVRFINWSQYARSGSLKTRNQTGSEQQRIAIIMDTGRNSQDPYVFLPEENKVLEVTLALTYFFCQNQTGVTEYHLGKGLVRLFAENTGQFEAVYEALSLVAFQKENTHRLLKESVKACKELMDSAAVFLILSSWNEETAALLSELERGQQVNICLVSRENIDLPDLTDHKNVQLFRILPEGGGAS